MRDSGEKERECGIRTPLPDPDKLEKKNLNRDVNDTRVNVVQRFCVVDATNTALCEIKLLSVNRDYSFSIAAVVTSSTNCSLALLTGHPSPLPVLDVQRTNAPRPKIINGEG